MPIARELSADRIGGAIWLVFGVVVVYGAWTMDRLESLGIPPLTAPGLVPGLFGMGFILFGLILMGRRAPGMAAQPKDFAPSDAPTQAAPEAPEELHVSRMALSWALCMIYAALLLGRGLPYWVLTAGFLFLHVLLLDETERVPGEVSPRRLLLAAIIAPAVATVVTLVFQYVFLVRLP
jgi:putative tricarboxylic transport membrane protein